MKKIITLLIIFLCSQAILATEIINNQITLPKHYKTENTFSGDLSETSSFHLIFTKNKKTKKFEVFSYLFDGEKIDKLPSFINEKSYSVVSFHQKNNILSLLLSYKIKKESFVKRIDFNLITKDKTEQQPFKNDDFLNSIRQKDTSILIYKNDDSFKIVSYIGNSTPTSKELKFKGKKDKLKKFFKDKSVSSVKTDEFVANGSTSDVRVYFENNTLFFTKDTEDPFQINVVGIDLNNKRTNVTQVLKFDLNRPNLTPNFVTFKNASEKKFKKATSFLSNNKLFQLALSKDTGIINISDINTGTSLNTIILNETLTSKAKGNPDFKDITSFLKKAGKNRYKATITANKTKTDKIRVRIDYVDIAYNYNYDWWWHHQQFIWQQQQHQMFIQQQVRSIPTGFGPRQPNNDIYPFVFSEKKRFFELVLDANGQLLDEDLPESFYKEIDKKEYIDKLEDIKGYSMQSSCFLTDSFRFIAYNKKMKKFVIQTNSID